MTDRQVQPAPKPTMRAIVRTVALGAIGLVIGVAVAILGLATVMTLWWEVMWKGV
jgi:hypothetical protein